MSTPPVFRVLATMSVNPPAGVLPMTPGSVLECEFTLPFPPTPGLLVTRDEDHDWGVRVVRVVWQSERDRFKVYGEDLVAGTHGASVDSITDDLVRAGWRRV